MDPASVSATSNADATPSVPVVACTSVCGGVEPDTGPGYAGVLSLDLSRLCRVLEVDPISRAARIQAGAFGPDIDLSLVRTYAYVRLTSLLRSMILQTEEVDLGSIERECRHLAS